MRTLKAHMHSVIARTCTHQQIRILATQLETARAEDHEQARELSREKELLQEKQIRLETQAQDVAKELSRLSEREAHVLQIQAQLSGQLHGLHQVTFDVACS
jgi:hypothetical protein